MLLESVSGGDQAGAGDHSPLQPLFLPGTGTGGSHQHHMKTTFLHSRFVQIKVMIIIKKHQHQIKMKDTHKHIIIGGWRGGGRPWAPPSSGYFATLAPLQEAVVPGCLITAICHTL